LAKDLDERQSARQGQLLLIAWSLAFCGMCWHFESKKLRFLFLSLMEVLSGIIARHFGARSFVLEIHRRVYDHGLPKTLHPDFRMPNVSLISFSVLTSKQFGGCQVTAVNTAAVNTAKSLRAYDA
jgi:hypothetical protein